MDTAADRVAQLMAEWRRERPDLDPSPQGVIGRLHRLARALSKELDAVYSKHGLSEPEFDLLATLRRAGPPYERAAGDLATHTMVTTGGLTKRVDRLEERGLVTRSGAPGDARRRLVRLTTAGRKVIDGAFTDHIANEHRLLADLGKADAAALEPILQRWLRVLGAD
ncbi:MarR family winged helix-turn-helix transcriptional regulator [Homoserinimonas sp. OAct 916]|uniref:MarR family winged helix-turn-helix transcriptional regulator n=1 Tax=Homoserinimonas sp. OAct 916 TaxID=2211450 RepID=UPI000DBE498E|nr:MarR family transcriptional regulator [Homoserinimonas sp. OAct 916]